ncbi:hypothetical protein [Pseudomonas sp. JS425]|uniref:hypothetical protein n=1 Tax=Pseudomonas sp. JS425 TaxID=2829498 RepID=UPI001BAECA7B|nr:hypothetical protein [Pseudomonas sp. JS425]QUN68101.1 hypothetical protein KDB76_01735 [Pseudomonas sp. JS425]
MEKLGWRDRRISPDSGSLFQTFPKGLSMAQSVGGIERIGQVVYRAEAKQGEKVTEILYAAHALGHAFLRLTFARWRPPSAVERAMPPG